MTDTHLVWAAAGWAPVAVGFFCVLLALLVAGHSNRGIASTLVVTEDTVKTHIRSLYRKLDVQDRGGAIAFALREGLFR